MKKLLKKFLKKILKAKENETVSDAFNRLKYSFLKKINRTKFDTNDLHQALISLGLNKGDTVIVQCAWRAFIGYTGTPKDVINCIKNIVGVNGTILMPAYTSNSELFKFNDTTNAGYLAEYFRENYAEFRSLDTKFSMCASGYNAESLTKDHINSYYCFDENSPYYKAIKVNAKILLLGLGKYPHKVTLFHCVTYKLRNTVKCYKDVYTFKKSVYLYDKIGKLYKKEIVDRQPRYQNNKYKFALLFNKLVAKKCYFRLNKLDIYLFDSLELFESAKKYIVDNNYNLYK